jgi:hypothetical protein
MRLLAALILAASSSPSAFAQGSEIGFGPYLQIQASYQSVMPDLKGAEAGFSLIMHPLSERAFFVAPRVGFLLAGGSTTRWDLNSGLEVGVWLVNAFSLGVAFDVAQPAYDATNGGSLHYRLDPFLGVRVLRLGREAAMGIRLGAPWDTRYQWAFHAGLTVQFAGVPVAWKYWE